MRILCIVNNKLKLNWLGVWKKDLSSFADVFFYGSGYPEYICLESVINELKIDCLLVCGLPKHKYFHENFKKLKIFKAIILFDYNIMQSGSGYIEYDKFLQKNDFNLLFPIYDLADNKLKDTYNTKIMKLSVPPLFYNRNEIRDIDVMSSGSTNPRF